MTTSKEKIFIIGASGQIGVELTLALRNIYGNNNVIASDLREINPLISDGPSVILDAMNREMLHVQVIRQNVTQIYVLAAMLSATGEKHPHLAWSVNMQVLLNALEIARKENIRKVYWPSSIAVFGPSSPKINCPQSTIIEPTTVYGISKHAGESWCEYYNSHYNIDVRSVRYPGIISYKSAPGGGTTDYAVEMFYDALEEEKAYKCFLNEHTQLPMMYMPDAVRATIELMEAPAEKIKNHRSYNLAGVSFSPREIAAEIRKHIPEFEVSYEPDYRQAIADSWPSSIDDKEARADWGWQHEYDLSKMTADMLKNLSKR